MKRIAVGQRIRIVAEQLIQAHRVGTVVEHSTEGGYYVHLDNDSRPNALTFFYAEEVELVAADPAPALQTMQPPT